MLRNNMGQFMFIRLLRAEKKKLLESSRLSGR